MAAVANSSSEIREQVATRDALAGRHRPRTGNSHWVCANLNRQGICIWADSHRHQKTRDVMQMFIRKGASREEFAKAIALYACKYNKNENVQRERIKRDGDTFDKLWRIPRSA